MKGKVLGRFLGDWWPQGGTLGIPGPLRHFATVRVFRGLLSPAKLPHHGPLWGAFHVKHAANCHVFHVKHAARRALSRD